jgi:ACS family glucarate transporter-like MFS transporter
MVWTESLFRPRAGGDGLDHGGGYLAQELIGASGGVFNMIGNIAAVITPIVMGYIVAATGSFYWAIAFVFLHCLVGFFAVSVLIGRIQRITLEPAG